MKNSFLLGFLFHMRLQFIGLDPSTLGITISFTQSYLETPLDAPRNNI
jgi:hypothetical protein